MNLSEKVVRQIERGEKTEHRIPVGKPTTVKRPPIRALRHKDDPPLRRAGDSATYDRQPFKPTVGQSLVVQSRTDHEDEKKRKPEVRIRVLEVTTATVGDTGLQGAKAEGFQTLAEFASDWMRRYDTHWPPTTEALCKECGGHKYYDDHSGDRVRCDYCDEVGTVQVEDKERLADTELVIARFQRRHAHHLVHVVRFELDTDVLTWVNRRNGEPPTISRNEALDPDAPLLGDPHPDWRDRAEQRRREALRDTRISATGAAELDRIVSDLQAEAKRLAAKNNADVSSLIREINHKVDRIKRKVAGTELDRRAA